jgi:uncharacterized membrane protein YqiK
LWDASTTFKLDIIVGGALDRVVQPKAWRQAIPPNVTSRGRRVRAIRKKFPAKGRASGIDDELISAIKAKAEAEARAAKALEEVLAAKGEAEARAAKALEEVLAAKAEADVRAVKAQRDAQTAKVQLEKQNLLYSIQQAALLRLRGKLNMRGLLGE